jgi:hypothetical protein
MSSQNKFSTCRHAQAMTKLNANQALLIISPNKNQKVKKYRRHMADELVENRIAFCYSLPESCPSPPAARDQLAQEKG